MHRGAVAVVATTVSVVACSAGDVIFGFPVDDRVGTEIIAYREAEGVSWRVAVVSLAQPRQLLPWDVGDGRGELQAIIFALRPEELSLREGELVEAPGDGRLLPTYERRIFSLALDGDEPGKWAAIAEMDPVLAGFRFLDERESVGECVGRGGCYLRIDEDAPCVSPCPAPDPVTGPTPPTPAAPPAPVELAPCPDGWNEVDTSDPVTCEPPPGGPGGPCPMGQWPSDLSGGTEVLYVDPDAAPPGVGTEAEPFSAIATAVASARDGALIVLSKGTHETPAVTIGRPLRIRGACARETLVSGGALFDVVSSDVHFEELSMSATHGAIHVFTGSITADAVAIEGDHRIAELVLEEGTGAAVSDFYVRTTTVAFVVTRNAELTATRMLVDGASIAIRIGAGRARIERSVIRNAGAVAEVAQARLELERVELHAGRGVVEESGEIEIRHAIFDKRDGGSPWAIYLGGGRVDAGPVLIRGAYDTTIVVHHGVLALQDAELHDPAVAMLVEESGRAEIERMKVDRATGAVLLLRSASTATITDLAVSNTGSMGQPTHGVIFAADAKALDLGRTTISDTAGDAIALFGAQPAASIHLYDLLIWGTREEAGHILGRALQLSSGNVGTLEGRLERISIVHAREGLAIDNSEIELADLYLKDIESVGLSIQRDAFVVGERIAIDGSVIDMVAGDSSRASLSNVQLANASSMLGIEPCGACPMGAGIYVRTNADVSLERFSISNCERVGADVAARLTLTNGTISDSPVGTRFEVDADETRRRVAQKVVYRGIAANIENE